MTPARFVLCFFVLILFSSSHASVSWPCKEMASEKNGPHIFVCGVGRGKTEGEAREEALLRAKREFELICGDSADCVGKETLITPLRNSCERGTEDYECHRALQYRIIESGKTFSARTRSSTSAMIMGLGLGDPKYKAKEVFVGMARKGEKGRMDFGIGLFFHEAGETPTLLWKNGQEQKLSGHSNLFSVGLEAAYILPFPLPFPFFSNKIFPFGSIGYHRYSLTDKDHPVTVKESQAFLLKAGLEFAFFSPGEKPSFYLRIYSLKIFTPYSPLLFLLGGVLHF